jgi:hypothetical protein
MGDRTAARGDLGRLTGAFGKLVGNMGPVGDALFPVYKMGMNLANRMVESSPLGLVGTGLDVGKAAVGRGPYAGAGGFSAPAGNAVGPIGERLANNIVGTALSVWLASKATEGAITGNGPSDPAQRAVWVANGNQPNSFQGPDGVYRSWGKLPPQLRGPMMAAGAYADAVQAYNKSLATQSSAGPQAYNVQDPREAAAFQLLSEVGQQLLSATPLRTFANLYDALQTNSVGNVGLTGLSDVTSSVAGGLVPWSGAVRSVAQMTDPLERQPLTARTIGQLPQAIGEQVQQSLPGVRQLGVPGVVQGLPARQDVLGRPLSNPLQGLGDLVPVHAAAGQPSPVLAAMQTAGVAPPAAPPTIPYGPTHEIQLTPEQRQAYESYRGAIIQRTAGPLVQSDHFQQLTPYAQSRALKNIQDNADAAASRLVLRDIVQSPGRGQDRWQATPGGALAPVLGYGPDVLTNQLQLQQEMQRQYQHQALMQSLLGG